MPMMTAEDLAAFMKREFPQSHPERNVYEKVGNDYVRMRRKVDAGDLRPGGTVSGPTMMALADNAMYAVLLSRIGPVALAVTTNLNINFLRKPELTDLVAEARLLKLGRRLAVGEITIFSHGMEAPVAHATITYSIPPS